MRAEPHLRISVVRRIAPLALALLCGTVAGCARESDSQVTAPAPASADAALQITVTPVTLRPTKRLLKFVGPLSPGLIKVPGSDDYLYVIMPVRVAM